MQGAPNPTSQTRNTEHQNCAQRCQKYGRRVQNRTKIDQNGAPEGPRGGAGAPKWSKMEPLRVPGGGFWTPWAALGALWSPLGAPLGPFGAQGGFLHRFWNIFGTILGAKMEPKSDKKQGCFRCHILGSFLHDFELFLERILDTFRQFQPKIEKWVKMCI